MLLVQGLSQSCSQTGGWRWRFNLKSWLEGLPLQAPVCGCWGRLQLFKQVDDRLRAQFLGDWLFPPGTSPPAWVTLEKVRERYQDSAIIFLPCNLTSHIPPFLPYSNSLEALISTTHIQRWEHIHTSVNDKRSTGERLLLNHRRCWDSWPPEEKNSIRGQGQGLITLSFCVIKFY